MNEWVNVSPLYCLTPSTSQLAVAFPVFCICLNWLGNSHSASWQEWAILCSWIHPQWIAFCQHGAQEVTSFLYAQKIFVTHNS